MLMRCRNIMQMNPVLWCYACLWHVIAIRTFVGAMKAAPPAQM